jgi:hypothetical protein
MLPKNISLLAKIRKSGIRPNYPVLVFIGQSRQLPKIYSDMPLPFECCIREKDDIDKLELWPLADLELTVIATETNDFTRKVLSAIVKRARTSFLMGGCPESRLIFCWSPARDWDWEVVDEPF